MASLVVSNNAKSTLAADVETGDTTITIQVGDASKFPALGAGQWFPLAVTKPDATFELMRCTARAGALLTVVRGQEGTSPLAFATGAAVDLRLTRAAWETKLDDEDLQASSAKATLDDDDRFIGLDSEDSEKRVTWNWSAILAAIWAKLGGLIAGGPDKAIPVDADKFPMADSAAGDASKYVTWARIKAVLADVFAEKEHTHVAEDVTDLGTGATRDIWTGNQAAYDAIPVKDADTLYFVTA